MASTSTLFIVRIWREPGARGRAMFRASVRAVDAERESTFKRAADLARYLETSTSSALERKPTRPH